MQLIIPCCHPNRTDNRAARNRGCLPDRCDRTPARLWQQLTGTRHLRQLMQGYGSSSLRVILDWTEENNSCTEQIDAGTAVHRPLEHFQPVYLTFSLAVAPDLGNGIAIRREIQA
jgi:hypothetical protein